MAKQVAQVLGLNGVGSMWRSGYDMKPEEFSAEMDRVWGQVKPLYDALHCHVRAKLNEKYGDDIVDTKSEIPAHLLGNMWAQTWGNVYDLAAPVGGSSVDVTKKLEEKGYDSTTMVKQAEGVFTSLGFDPLPDTVWTR